MTLAVFFAVGLFGWLCVRPAHVSVSVLVCTSQVANVSAGIMLKLVMAKAKAEWGCWTIEQLWPFQVLLHRKQDPSQIWEELTCGGAIQPKGCPYLFYCKLVRNICECTRANVNLLLGGSSSIWSVWYRFPVCLSKPVACVQVSMLMHSASGFFVCVCARVWILPCCGWSLYPARWYD